MTHRPRKRFGQHFLHDPAIIERIVDAIDPLPGQRLVEIGPGQGAITRPLLARLTGALSNEPAGPLLDVIELDRDLAANLKQTYADDSRIEIHVADALRFDFIYLATLRSSEPNNANLRVVGNLPYNISTPLMFRLIEQERVIHDMHFMLQKEVVDRLTAKPGSKAYGRLSVMIATHCAASHLFDIGRGAFKPAPKVTSAFVRLAPHAEPPFHIKDTDIHARMVNQAFSMRRKTLRNSVRGYLDVASIEAAGIDPQRRPETISPAEFASLANIAADLHL